MLSTSNPTLESQSRIHSQIHRMPESSATSYSALTMKFTLTPTSKAAYRNGGDGGDRVTWSDGSAALDGAMGAVSEGTGTVVRVSARTPV